MKKTAMAFIGIGLLSLPFSVFSHAETKPDNPLAESDNESPKPREATKPGETDITNTKAEGGIPSKYTIMPVATGKKMEVDSEMIGYTVKNSKAEELGKLEQLIMDSETKRIEYAMISIGDTGQLKAYPWSSFKVNKEQGNVVLNVTKEQLGMKSADLSPDIQALEQQLQSLRKSEARKGAREGQNFGDRDASGPMGEDKRSGGAEAPPVSGK
jgi:sporulation protein YlmC with PRC-barrel domain